MLLSERQRVSGAKDPVAALNQSRRKFHLQKVLELLNFTLLGDLFYHFCTGQSCCPGGVVEFEEKLGYHLLCLLEDGVPKFMATRFTKIFATPAFVCPMQSLCNFGATAFFVAFKKNVEEAIQTIKDDNANERDPLADISWVVENSKRLVETADRLGLDTSRFDNLRFLMLGSILAPLLWTIFDTDHQSGDTRTGKTSWDVVCRARAVQRALRATLRPDSPQTQLLLAFRPREWTVVDVYEAQRSDVFCFTTSVFLLVVRFIDFVGS